ncbi:MAG: hypothetical protein NC240_08350 [Clostridium sp.]|nr:hypothetical protein [Clostridium sp.]
MIARLVVLVIAILIMTEGILWHRSLRDRKRNKKKALTEQTPPIFKVENNYIPINDVYNITISDFIEYGTLLQIQCSITQGGKLVRGFCTRDLLSFEQKIRSEIRMIFDQLEDENTDRTIKIWYSNQDGSDFGDTNDIPLRVIITFFKPSNMDDKTKELLKQCLYPHLRALVEVDWNEINTILKNCYAKEKRLMKSLNIINNSWLSESGISDSAKSIIRHLCMDMTFFYENQQFYGADMSSVFSNLKEKYPKIEEIYLEKLAFEFARDTVF